MRRTPRARGTPQHAQAHKIHVPPKKSHGPAENGCGSRAVATYRPAQASALAVLDGELRARVPIDAASGGSMTLGLRSASQFAGYTTTSADGADNGAGLRDPGSHRE